MNNKKLINLKWWDILILTIIMFSQALYNSNFQYFFINKSETDLLNDSVNFSQYDNYYALAVQSFLIVLAVSYLKFRNFDFSKWKFEISIKNSMIGIVLFFFIAFVTDIYFYGIHIFHQTDLNVINQDIPDISGYNIDFSVIIYSMLNGIYEELFFLGICLSVLPSNLKKAFLFSLLVRFAIHTYQGIYAALGISLILGIIYFILYTKFSKNLFIFFISHAIADILGLSILQFLSFD